MWPYVAKHVLNAEVHGRWSDGPAARRNPTACRVVVGFSFVLGSVNEVGYY